METEMLHPFDFKFQNVDVLLVDGDKDTFRPV